MFVGNIIYCFKLYNHITKIFIRDNKIHLPMYWSSPTFIIDRKVLLAMNRKTCINEFHIESGLIGKFVNLIMIIIIRCKSTPHYL